MYDNASLEKPEVLIQQLEAGKAYIATVTALNKKVILSSPSSSSLSSLFLSSTSSYFSFSGSKSLSAQNGRNTAAAGAPACGGEDRGEADGDGDDADDDDREDADDDGENAGADSARLQLCECEKGPCSFPFKDAKGNFLRNYKQMQCSAYQQYGENQPELCTLYGKQIYSVCENMAACNILTCVYSR